MIRNGTDQSENNAQLVAVRLRGVRYIARRNRGKLTIPGPSWEGRIPKRYAKGALRIAEVCSVVCNGDGRASSRAARVQQDGLCVWCLEGAHMR